MVYEVTSKADLEQKLVEAGDKLVVIDFYAVWCGPCKRISPILEEIGTKYGEKLYLMKVDIDKNSVLAEEYGIDVMPTFVFKRMGKHLDTLVGSNEEKLRHLVEKHLGTQ